jgi:TatD DNase family protein
MPSGVRNETAETGGAMVDAHCHIDLYLNPESIAAESEAGRIYTIAVTNAPSVFHYTALLAANRKYIRAAVGLHPELVHSHGRELDLLWPLLDQTRYVGEVGLDYTTTDQSERRAQRDVFTKILERCSGYRNKVITLHSRRAAGDVITAVGNNYPGKVILHWFSGSGAELERAADFGMYFSVNTSMVNSKKGQALIAKMPADRVITESDGPFINVVNEPARPHHMEKVIERLGLLWGLSFEESRARVISNFRNLITEES